jgi:hypothetical protein
VSPGNTRDVIAPLSPLGTGSNLSPGNASTLSVRASGGSSVDGLRANDMEPVLGDENNVGGQEIVQSEPDASGGVKNTAEAAVSDESVKCRDDIHADNLMLYEAHRRDDQLPVNQLLPVTLMLLGDQLEVFER